MDRNFKFFMFWLILCVAINAAFASEDQNIIRSMAVIYGEQGLRVDLAVNSSPQDFYKYNIKIYKPGGQDFLWQGKPDSVFSFGKNQLSLIVNGLKPELWQPNNPVLYMVELLIMNDIQAIESCTIRTGFRIFGIEGGEIYLNHKPIFLRGIAINPPGRGIPKELEESREFALDYIAFMKSINVNIIRIPDNEVWYNVCDELGMMVFGGNYSGTVKGKKPPKNYDEGVDWYKNVKFRPIMHHPSLVIYALTNEVPYRGDIAQKWIDFLSYAHNELLKWDNTRLYIGNAGYGYGQSGDICDLHRYWGWYYSSPYTFLHIRDDERITLPDKIQPLTFTECVGNYTGPDGRYNLTPNHKNPVSQLNWTGHAPQEVQQLLADEHQIWVFKEATELMRRLRRINPESSGIFPFTILFRNWHTAIDFVDMDPKPVTRQARISYQPVLLSWENWQPQVYSNKKISPIAHIVNDSEDYTNLENNQLIVRLLDKAYTVQWTDTIQLPDIAYFDILSRKLDIKLPEHLFTGYYQLEGIVISSGKEVSRNSEKLYISNNRIKKQSDIEVPVYDPTGKTISALQKLGYSIKKLNAGNLAKNPGLLVIGENAADQNLASINKDINNLLKKGCRILVLSQDETHQEFVKIFLPAEVIFPSMDIDNPAYPPPARPSKNSFNINPERPGHPVFSGITRKELKIWSDYTNWDETQGGYPAIYPVINGFTLKDKNDRCNTAILANYSVGLEGIALAEFFSSKGSLLLSGFDLINRIGLDPIADKLFCNLIAYSFNNSDHSKYPLIDAPIIWGRI